MRMLITGASGSGTSTLGAALASALGFASFDADDFYWLPTQPPFTTKRARDVRLAMLLAALADAPDAIVSGSVIDWGPALERSFDLVVFLTLDTPTRLARLRARERQVRGFVDDGFLAWAASYDETDAASRSRARDERWLADRPNVLRLDGALPTEQQVARVRERIGR